MPTGLLDRACRFLPIGNRATFVVLPIPHGDCRARGVVAPGRGPLRRPEAERRQVLRAMRAGEVAEHDHPRPGLAPISGGRPPLARLKNKITKKLEQPNPPSPPIRSHEPPFFMVAAPRKA